MRVFAMVAAMMTAGICAAGSVTMITDLEADTAKSVTGAQSNVLALAAAHTNRTDNPHGVTAAQIGALTSETDAAALAVIASYAATNQVKHLYDSASINYLQTLENGTGTVWYLTTGSGGVVDTNVFSKFATEAMVTTINENLNACYIAISNQVGAVQDEVDALPAALQPYALVSYGDLATTNTAGFAGYQATNGATSSLTTVDPVINQKLAAFRYDITNTIYGSVSFSSWVQSAAGSSNNVTFTRLLAYTAGNALLASNDGARVESLPASYSNVTAAVALPYAVTNGYIIAEVYSATNTARDCMIHAGGSYPTALNMSARPLNYATPAEFAWTSGVLNGTNGTYRSSGTNVYWILTP